MPTLSNDTLGQYVLSSFIQESSSTCGPTIWEIAGWRPCRAGGIVHSESAVVGVRADVQDSARCDDAHVAQTHSA